MCNDERISFRALHRVLLYPGQSGKQLSTGTKQWMYQTYMKHTKEPEKRYYVNTTKYNRT